MKKLIIFLMLCVLATTILTFTSCGTQKGCPMRQGYSGY